MDLNEAVITRHRRVPLPEPVPGNGVVVTRQLDAALASAGFKLSRELFADLSAREAGQVVDVGVAVLSAARKLAGDHVRHNPYFRDFPFNVPATLEFWAELMARALAVGIVGGSGVCVEIRGGELAQAGSLLSLPGYGTVQHTYEDMLAAHEALAASAGDRVTVLHKGETARAEAQALYLELAGSPVPLAGEDLDLLAALAADCAAGPQPARIPVRENRAAINKVALASGHPLLADTVTDVLRLAVAVSGGDVTLETTTKFRSFARAERRTVMAALDSIVRESPAKLADAAPRAEQWKRLGERLHPHEHGAVPAGAARVRGGPGRGAVPVACGTGRGALPLRRDRGGGTATGGRARHAVPVARPVAARCRPGGARCRSGPRCAGLTIRIRAGAAVGAGALPEPG